MTFFPEPINPSEGRKEEEIRVSPIEANKLRQEEQEWEKIKPKQPHAVYTAFLCFAEKLVSLLGKGRGGSLEAMSEDSLVQDLQMLKQMLQILMDRDQSGNITFYEQFSEIWLRIMQGGRILSRSKRKTIVDPNKIQALTTTIDQYPPNENHKLGYYLSACSGQRWLPLPLQEILKRLFTDHRINQQNSILASWIELLNDCLQS